MHAIRNTVCLHDRPMNAVVEFTEADTRRTKGGTPYIRARARIHNSNRIIDRTVMLRGKGYQALHTLAVPGNVVRVCGYYNRMVGEDGTLGGEFYSPFRLIEVLRRAQAEAANDHEPTRTVTGHDRDGHWRKFKNGVYLQESDWIWVRASKINGGAKAA